MRNFNWDEFKTQRIAVNCKTLGDAQSFIKEAKKNGIEWCCGDELCETETEWCTYKENTHYATGFLGDENNKMCFGASFDDDGYKIIVWEDESREYTFEEVIANVKIGETYVPTNDSSTILDISRDEEGDICIDFHNDNSCIFPTLHKYKLKQPKLYPITLCTVKISPDGTTKDFITFDTIKNGILVSCEEESGKLYGISVQTKDVMLTKEQVDSYKQCTLI